MKKGLFSLIAAAIALVSFSKKDDSNLTFKSADLKVKDGSSNSLKEYSFTRNTDTTKKGGGRRNNETPYRQTGNGGKEGHGGNGKKETGGKGGDGKEGAGGKGGKVTSDPGTGGVGKTEAVIFRQKKK